MSRILHSFLLFCQIDFGATILSQFIESRWIGLGNVLVAAAQGALILYERHQEPRSGVQTPYEATHHYDTSNGI